MYSGGIRGMECGLAKYSKEVEFDTTHFLVFFCRKSEKCCDFRLIVEVQEFTMVILI